MKAKFSILIITAFIGMTAISNITDDDFYPIKYTTICKFYLFGDGKENIAQQNLIITDSNSWNVLLTKMTTSNNVIDRFSETNIDFSKYQVIAIFDKIRTNGGHSIDLNVMSNSEKIIVRVTYLSHEGNVSAVICQPFHIIKIPKTNKMIIFE